MAFSKLLGRDANEVTPQHAGAVFAEEAKRIAKDQNVDFARAWNIAKRLHPEAHARLSERRDIAQDLQDNTKPNAATKAFSDYREAFERESALANGDPVVAHAAVMTKPQYATLRTALHDNAQQKPSHSPMPPGYPFYLPGLGLPASTTLEEFKAAWRANGDRLIPLNKAAIFDALVKLYQRTKRMSEAEARGAVAAKFPSVAGQEFPALTNDTPMGGEAENLAIIAHLASAGARGKRLHHAAAFAHERAAAAQSDSRMRKVHEQLAKFHHTEAE